MLYQKSKIRLKISTRNSTLSDEHNKISTNIINNLNLKRCQTKEKGS
jgi:hypothetical protein